MIFFIEIPLSFPGRLCYDNCACLYLTILVGTPRFGCSQPGHLYANYNESPHTVQAGWGDVNLSFFGGLMLAVV